MKVHITEKQYNLIKKMIDEGDLEEQVEVPSEPSSGVSNVQSGGEGYPEVGKWESGVTRGPANQIGVTKWSDIVGSSLTRGKSNPLK